MIRMHQQLETGSGKCTHRMWQAAQHHMAHRDLLAAHLGVLDGKILLLVVLRNRFDEVEVIGKGNSSVLHLVPVPSGPEPEEADRQVTKPLATFQPRDTHLLAELNTAVQKLQLLTDVWNRVWRRGVRVALSDLWRRRDVVALGMQELCHLRVRIKWSKAPARLLMTCAQISQHSAPRCD